MQLKDGKQIAHVCITCGVKYGVRKDTPPDSAKIVPGDCSLCGNNPQTVYLPSAFGGMRIVDSGRNTGITNS